MSVTRLGRRLFHDTDGQVLLFGVILVVAILAFLLAMPNATQVTTQRMRAQTAADVGAYTGSVWLARALNLNASMNVGIRSVYTWMTVLTMGEAMAKALYSDSLDPTVSALGGQMTSALFGNSNPITVDAVQYPASIRKLDTTAQWLYSLQTDIVANFHSVAATLGTEDACRNAGAYPSSPTAGASAIVRTNDSIPLLVANAYGDSLMYAALLQLGPALQTIPTNDTNIGPVTGTILVDSHDFEIKANYGFSGRSYDVRQVLNRTYHYYVRQIYWLESTMMCFDADTAYAYFDTKTQLYYDYLNGTKWILPHTNPQGRYWLLHEHLGFTYGSGRDTVVVGMHVCKTPLAKWNYHPYHSGCGILPEAQPYVDLGGTVDSSMTIADSLRYTGAESTTLYRDLKVRPRRVNPNREFHTVAYAWRKGASTTPFGLSPRIAPSLFPRSKVAAASPMLSLARSEVYPGMANPTDHDYYFVPAWYVRLTPMDSAGVHEIASDTAYGGHTQNSFNLEGLRKYALLP